MSPLQWVAIIPFALAFAQPGTDRKACTVEGQVSDSTTGKPLSAAALTIAYADGAGSHSSSAQQPVTGPDGKFAFTGLERGRYRLLVKKAGFAARSSGWLVGLSEQTCAARVSLRLAPLSAISGRVINEDGAPLAKALVEAVKPDYRGGAWKFNAFGSASTDDLGEYRIFGLPPGRYMILATPAPELYPGVSASPVDWSSQTYTPTLHPAAADADSATLIDANPGATATNVQVLMRKQRAVRLSGRIVCDGCRISVPLTVTLTAPQRRTYRVRSDPDGAFEIQGVASGDYRIVTAFSQSGRAFSGAIPVRVGEADIEGLQLTIGPPVEISGRVHYADGTISRPALAPFHLLLTQGENVATAEVAPDGGFHFAGLRRDAYTLSSEDLPDGLALENLPAGEVDLTSGAALPLDLVVRRTESMLDGTVKDASGQLVPWASIVMIPAGMESRLDRHRFTTADQEGRFELRGLPAGEYAAYAWEDLEFGGWMQPGVLVRGRANSARLTVQDGGSYFLALVSRRRF